MMNQLKHGLISIIICVSAFSLFVITGMLITWFNESLTLWIILIAIYGFLETISLIFGILALNQDQQRVLGIYSIIIAVIVLLMVLPAIIFLYLPNL